MDAVRIADIEAAINVARQHEPARGSEAALSADVAVLAAIYGEMIWFRRSSVSLAELTDAQRAVFERWRPA